MINEIPKQRRNIKHITIKFFDKLFSLNVTASFLLNIAIIIPRPENRSAIERNFGSTNIEQSNKAIATPLKTFNFVFSFITLKNLRL